MKIKDIISNDFLIEGNTDNIISGISYNSKTIKPGNLFVAIKGENFDGNIFIETAIKKGAGAILCQDCSIVRLLKSKYPDNVWLIVKDTRYSMAYISSKYYGNPSLKLVLIGITGTNGKTTTSYLMKSVCEIVSNPVGLIGTINYLIGQIIFKSRHTTPEAPDFQSLLKKMLDNGCSYAISEVSSHSLSKKRVHCSDFKVAIFTNLSRDHLDFHLTMENYFKSKLILFEKLLCDNGFAVINIDDPYGQKLAYILKTKSYPKRKNIITFGIENKSADVKAFDIKTRFKGSSFGVSYNNNIEDNMFCPIVGAINIYNCLSVFAAGLSLGISVETIRTGISSVRQIKGRFEKVDLGQKFLVVIDYAHSYDSFKNLLFIANNIAKSNKSDGKIITVFGCGGNRDKGKRPQMGNIATRLSDVVIITTDNPRYENPLEIIKDIESGIEKDNYIIISDRKRAIQTSIKLASIGDIVLLAGKGHETYQEIKDRFWNFSDKKEAEDAIKRFVFKY